MSSYKLPAVEETLLTLLISQSAKHSCKRMTRQNESISSAFSTFVPLASLENKYTVHLSQNHKPKLNITLLITTQSVQLVNGETSTMLHVMLRLTRKKPRCQQDEQQAWILNAQHIRVKEGLAVCMCVGVCLCCVPVHLHSFLHSVQQNRNAFLREHSFKTFPNQLNFM